MAESSQELALRNKIRAAMVADLVERETPTGRIAK